VYLLCDTDLEWEYDPVRENPDIRNYLTEMYKNIIVTNKFPYFVVSGFGKNRTNNAVKIIDVLI